MIKLNGGLGTSMGLDRAKSLLEVRDGLSFLDIIARQVLAARKEHGVALPLVFMDSFRTTDDTIAALAGYDLAVDGLPLDFLQNKEPKLRADDLTPVDVGGRARRWSGARRGTATSTPRCAAPGCSTGSSTPATSGRSSPTPTTSARPRTRGSPSGSPGPARRSPSRRSAVRRRTARAATSPVVRRTAGSCCARPRRPSTRTRTRWRTCRGTGSAPPTTCGSTWSRCATSSTAATASSGWR